MSPHKQKKKYCVRNIFSFSREPAKPMRNWKQTGLCKFPFLGGEGVNNLYYGQLETGEC